MTIDQVERLTMTVKVDAVVCASSREEAISRMCRHLLRSLVDDPRKVEEVLYKYRFGARGLPECELTVEVR